MSILFSDEGGGAARYDAVYNQRKGVLVGKTGFGIENLV